MKKKRKDFATDAEFSAYLDGYIDGLTWTCNELSSKSAPKPRSAAGKPGARTKRPKG